MTFVIGIWNEIQIHRLFVGHTHTIIGNTRASFRKIL